MASRTVRVAVTQAEPAWIDLPAGIEKTCTLIKEAAKNGAQLIAFPECWIPGYPCWIWSRVVDLELNIAYIKNSMRLESEEMQTIQACARTSGIAVSLGFSENSNNSLYIAQVLIGSDGEIKVHHRKLKPTHMERTVFGDASGHVFNSVAQLPFARVGGLNCWEHLQPLVKFATMSQHEEIHVAAWPSLGASDGAGFWGMGAEGCRTLSRTYGMEAGAFVLHSTTVITEKGVDKMRTTGGTLMSSPGGGGSVVFGPDGRQLTELVDETTETIIYCDLNMDDLVKVKMFADCNGHYSRPDLLWLGVDKEIKSMVRPQPTRSAAKEIGEESA